MNAMAVRKTSLDLALKVSLVAAACAITLMEAETLGMCLKFAANFGVDRVAHLTSQNTSYILWGSCALQLIVSGFYAILNPVVISRLAFSYRSDFAKAFAINTIWWMAWTFGLWFEWSKDNGVTLGVDSLTGALPWVCALIATATALFLSLKTAKDCRPAAV